MKLTNFGLISICSMFLGCASITDIDGGCGTKPNNEICLGEESIPLGQEDIFQPASVEVIDALDSEQFREDLVRFHSLFSTGGAHAGAWAGVDIEIVPDELISKVNGMQIETYGGIKGLFYKALFGNTAFDGSEDGPIMLNRWALPRSSASIANTISHETAHRIGLVHPNSGNDLEIANCEPPYVIGSLVQRSIDSSDWNLKNHCYLFESDEWGKF